MRLYDRPDQQALWDQLVATTVGHVLQSWAWGELKARFGWRVQRVAVDDACAQVLFRSLPGGLGTIAYVPKGPLADFRDLRGLQALLEAIHPLARKERAICLKIEPNLTDSPELAGQLQALGLRPSPQAVQPRRTILVDLDAEPEQVLGRMKQKTRYNVRLAARKGVTVRPGGVADLPAFYQLMEVTAKRDGFGIHTQAYYETAHHLFVSSGQGQLLLAEYQGQLLAGLVVFVLGSTAHGGTACYMYGASSDQHRNLMATYLLQWEAMLWAREQGCRTYDLWGVPDEDEAILEAEFSKRSDGLWGVYRFKRGFGGRLVRTAGAWDLVYAPLRYRLYTLAVGWLGRGQAQ
ncbi:MAG TPA: peptidoglycan bridge formation glycyltransferase FemA/FemB family protein [Anaerolineae bacterium]|nr:peptidoglycan bridge formation glycyltransferase FemA/FemB family protein [Anaerolineae bacterium]